MGNIHKGKERSHRTYCLRGRKKDKLGAPLSQTLGPPSPNDKTQVAAVAPRKELGRSPFSGVLERGLRGGCVPGRLLTNPFSGETLHTVKRAGKIGQGAKVKRCTLKKQHLSEKDRDEKKSENRKLENMPDRPRKQLGPVRLYYSPLGNNPGRNTRGTKLIDNRGSNRGKQGRFCGRFCKAQKKEGEQSGRNCDSVAE